MSIMALTGLLTGLKEFNLLIPWPYTGTNVVVELNWKSRKNKKNDKQYFVTNIVLQYCYTISAFDFQNVLIFKVYWFVESERRLSILLEISKLTFAAIPSSNSYLVMYTKDIFANVSVSLVHIKPGLGTLAVSIDPRQQCSESKLTGRVLILCNFYSPHCLLHFNTSFGELVL